MAGERITQTVKTIVELVRPRKSDIRINPVTGSQTTLGTGFAEAVNAYTLGARPSEIAEIINRSVDAASKPHDDEVANLLEKLQEIY